MSQRTFCCIVLLIASNLVASIGKGLLMIPPSLLLQGGCKLLPAASTSAPVTCMTILGSRGVTHSTGPTLRLAGQVCSADLFLPSTMPSFSIAGTPRLTEHADDCCGRPNHRNSTFRCHATIIDSAHSYTLVDDFAIRCCCFAQIC